MDTSTGKSKAKEWMQKVLVYAVIIFAVFIYVRYFFVFGTGVKAGQLNYVVHKGYVFKTYEGKLIQAGFRQPKNMGTTGVQSYEFEFSIADKEVADSLMRCSGREVELHYKEYFGAVPWRGYSKSVVDKIISIKND